MSDLLELLDRHPDDRIAVVDGEGAHCWGAIRAAAGAGAQRLRRLGEAALVDGEGRVGPRIGVLVAPGYRWLASMLAIWRAGMVALPLSPRYPDAELAGLIEDAGAVAVVSDAARSLPVQVLRPEAILAEGEAEAASATTQEPLAMLLYTSGTTGRPKGVRLAHRQLAHQARLLVDAWGLDQRRALLHTLPLHHMHGIAIAMLPCLAAGMRVVMLARFEAGAVFERLAEVDCFMGVPTMYHHLLEHLEDAPPEDRAAMASAARGLGLATSGSAALPVTLAERWRAVTGAIPLERYGMTEIGVGCSNPLEPAERRRGWVGRALPTLELRILDDQGRVSDGGPGMLQVRGPSVFEGYWRRPDATREAFDDGWFITGDIAERDGEGFVKLHGRRSVDILKSGGYKLSALEIEEHLRDHEAVAEVAVVGVADAVWGQRVAAVIVPRPGRDEQCQPASLRPWLEERIASYKVPRIWALRDELPKNALGKVLKPDLAASLTAK